MKWLLSKNPLHLKTSFIQLDVLVYNQSWKREQNMQYVTLKNNRGTLFHVNFRQFKFSKRPANLKIYLLNYLYLIDILFFRSLFFFYSQIVNLMVPIPRPVFLVHFNKNNLTIKYSVFTIFCNFIIIKKVFLK